MQNYQNNPTDLLAQELVEAYKAVNSLCASVAKKYSSKEDSPSLDQSFTLSRELLELDIAEEKWGDFEENTLEKPYAAVEEADQDSYRDDGTGILEDSEDFHADVSDCDDESAPEEGLCPEIGEVSSASHINEDNSEEGDLDFDVDKGGCRESFELRAETHAEVAFTDGFQEDDNILTGGVTDNLNTITEQSSDEILLQQRNPVKDRDCASAFAENDAKEQKAGFLDHWHSDSIDILDQEGSLEDIATSYGDGTVIKEEAPMERFEDGKATIEEHVKKTLILKKEEMILLCKALLVWSFVKNSKKDIARKQSMGSFEDLGW